MAEIPGIRLRETRAESTKVVGVRMSRTDIDTLGRRAAAERITLVEYVRRRAMQTPVETTLRVENQPPWVGEVLTEVAHDEEISGREAAAYLLGLGYFFREEGRFFRYRSLEEFKAWLARRGWDLVEDAPDGNPARLSDPSGDP